jgi:ammonium transporter, Amt family
MANAEGGQDLSKLNYTVHIPYPSNSGDANGGDSLTQDLNVYYESGNIAWILVATALVLLMIPGVG